MTTVVTERRTIDSVGTVELLTFLETRFDIQIDDDETVPGNIDTITNIVRFVGKEAERSTGGHT